MPSLDVQVDKPVGICQAQPCIQRPFSIRSLEHRTRDKRGSTRNVLPGSRNSNLRAFSSAEGVVLPTTDAAVPLGPSTLSSFSKRRQLVDGDGRLMLKNLTRQELEEWCLSEGIIHNRPKACVLFACLSPRYQVFTLLYAKGMDCKSKSSELLCNQSLAHSKNLRWLLCFGLGMSKFRSERSAIPVLGREPCRRPISSLNDS